jgi:ATP-binding cassette subfamily D (ALD) protein 3
LELTFFFFFFSNFFFSFCCLLLPDADLLRLLDTVQLSYLAERPNGFDAVEDWMDVLSGGEKQRVAMARLFYSAPQFAILDECTSAVSSDVEGRLYTTAREEGITLFTVSHRAALREYHTHVLEFDGRGGYTFGEIAKESKGKK